MRKFKNIESVLKAKIGDKILYNFIDDEIEIKKEYDKINYKTTLIKIKNDENIKEIKKHFLYLIKLYKLD